MGFDRIVMRKYYTGHMHEMHHRVAYSSPINIWQISYDEVDLNDVMNRYFNEVNKIWRDFEHHGMFISFYSEIWQPKK